MGENALQRESRMADGFTMRKAEEQDIPELAGLRRRMHEEIRLIRGLPLHPEELAAMEEAYGPFARARFKDGTMKAWVIEAEDQIVACGALLILFYPPFPGDPTGRVARLYSMYTRLEYRRRGFARRIAQQAIEHCKGQGIKRIVLGASLMGKPLYESLGFQTTNEMRMTFSEGR
jgi:GNAT superfamily N-acetyltransferase